MTVQTDTSENQPDLTQQATEAVEVAVEQVEEAVQQVQENVGTLIEQLDARVDNTLLGMAFWGNSLLRWLLAVIIAVLLITVFRFLRKLMRGRVKGFAKRTKTNWDNFLVDIFEETRGYFLVILAIFVASFSLNLPAAVHLWLRNIAIIGSLLQIALWLNSSISFWLDVYRKKENLDRNQSTLLAVLNYLLRLILYTVILMMVLANLDVNVSTLIAGLGITSLALALAVQNILSDLFASLSIVFDKPFEIGDFILVGAEMGTVETIGLRSTRVRSLTGERIVFANNDLLGSRIRNYRHQQARRIAFSFGVTYDTPLETLKEIPELVKAIVEMQIKTRFDRAHFKRLADYALEFEVVYHIAVPDYALYMDIQQAINLELMAQFAERGINFAYPTQAIILATAPQGDA
jgi:small-conductance mechanosensitive channel